jgi:hypothetical protein
MTTAAITVISNGESRVHQPDRRIGKARQYAAFSASDEAESTYRSGWGMRIRLFMQAE